MSKIGFIGNGISAVTTIREIRKNDPSVSIDVFTDERHAYYPRPKLIDFIAEKATIDQVIQYDVDWYEKQDVNLHLGEAITKIILSPTSLQTQLGTVHEFDKILYAAGSHPFIPPIKGTEKKGVHVLRTIDDAINIREDVKGAGREIVVGGGILGIELAAAMKHCGGEPIVVTNIDSLLPAQLDQGASSVLIQHLEELGLEILLNFTCTKISGDEHVDGVVSSAGDVINGDLVVAATGVKPNIMLAKDCGLTCGRGVQVNEYLQTTHDAIYAIGDSIEWNGMSWGIIPVALDTARVAAQNLIAPESASYAGTVPSNTLQVAGIDLTSTGFFAPKSPDYESIVSVDNEARTYLKVVIKDDKVVGGISLGNRKFALKLRRLLREGSDVSDIRDEIFEV